MRLLIMLLMAGGLLVNDQAEAQPRAQPLFVPQSLRPLARSQELALSHHSCQGMYLEPWHPPIRLTVSAAQSWLNQPMFYDDALAAGQSVNRLYNVYRIDDRWRHSLGLAFRQSATRRQLWLNLLVLRIPLVSSDRNESP